MPKKTTTLILILALVTGVLVFLAVSEGQKQTNNQTVPTPAKKVVKKTSKIFFSPQNLDLSSGSASTSSSVDLLVDTSGDDIAGVQAELTYDPKALTAVKLIPDTSEASFFGPTAVVLFNDVDKPTPGRISYAIAINAGQSTRRGTGKIATLTFQKAPGATSSSTTVNFVNKTLVTKLGADQSVLKMTTPLSITLSSSTPNQFYPPVSVIPSVPITTAPAQ